MRNSVVKINEIEGFSVDTEGMILLLRNFGKKVVKLIGPSMKAFNAGDCKDPVEAGASVSSADQSDANTSFDGFETVSSEAQDNLSDSSPVVQPTETVGSGDTVEKTEKEGSSNIGFMLVSAGVAVALLAILLVVMRPAV